MLTISPARAEDTVAPLLDCERIPGGRFEMKRDFDLRRKLLIYVEEKPGPELAEQPEVTGYDETIIQNHLCLMH